LQNAEAPERSRFIFPSIPVYDLPLGPAGLVSPVRFGAVIGNPILHHFSVRLVYGDSATLTLSEAVPDDLPELAGECQVEGYLGPEKAPRTPCQALYRTPLLGGGLVRIGGELQQIAESRLVVPLCLAPALFDATASGEHGAEEETGVATVAVIGTGMGVSLLTESSFQRLRAAGEDLPRIEGLTLHLPNGTETVALTTVPRAAIVSDESHVLGPCSELALRRRLLVARRDGLTAADRDLLDEREMNGASATIINQGIAFAVIRDDAPLIQGLRAELQPYTADIGAILGGSFLDQLEVTLDYPNSRTLVQCSRSLEPSACRVLPWCARDSEDGPGCL
jgi:hypothetical protein